jgi:hypothetical protein
MLLVAEHVVAAKNLPCSEITQYSSAERSDNNVLSIGTVFEAFIKPTLSLI